MNTPDEHYFIIQGINPYTVLGLNSNGKNTSAVPYTNNEIKKAFHKRALVTHPDKLLIKNDKFAAVIAAYRFLCDPKKKAKLDSAIVANPNAFDTDNLFIKMLTSLISADQTLEEQSGTSIVERTKRIDLTAIITDADCSPEHLLEQAYGNIAFARAVLDNSLLVRILSLENQYHLLFKLNAHQQELNSLSRAKHLLNYLNRPEFGNAFVSACHTAQDDAQLFIQTHPTTLRKLSKNQLLSLYPHYQTAAIALFEHYCSELRLSEIDIILAAYQNDEPLAVFNRHASKAQLENYQHYCFLRDTIIRLGGLFWEQNQEHNKKMKTALEKIGLEAVNLKQYVATHYMYLGLCYSIFSTLSKCNTSEFSRKYNIADRRNIETLVDLLFRTLELVRSDDFKQSVNFNLPVIQKILSLADDSSFLKILKRVHFEKLPSTLSPFFHNYVFEKVSPSTLGNNEPPTFYNLLQESNEVAVNLLNQYRSVFLQMFNHPQYLPLFTLPNMQTLVIRCFLTHQLSKSELPLESLSEEMRGKFELLNDVLQYINHNSGSSNDRKSKPIDHDTFNHFTSTLGFLPKYLEFNSDDQQVQFKLIQGAIELGISDYSKLPFSTCYKLETWLNEILQTAEKKLLLRVLSFFRGKYAPSLLNILDYPENNLYSSLHGHWIYFKKIADSDPRWIAKYLSGRNVYRFSAIKLAPKTLKALIRTLYNDFEWDFYYKHFWKLRQEIDSIDDDELIDKFEGLVAYYREKSGALEQYPNTCFSAWIKVSESNWFREKVQAYEKLVETLKIIQSSYDLSLADNYLNEILDLLTISGCDRQTFDLIQSKLSKQEALLIAILEELIVSDRIWISEALAKRIKKTLEEIPKLKQPLHHLFLRRAIQYLKSKYNTISGDELLTLVDIFSDQIMPVVTQYSLEDKLFSARQLANTLDKARNAMTAFENAEANITVLANHYFQKLNRLLDTLTGEKFVENSIVKRSITKLIELAVKHPKHPELAVFEKSWVNDPLSYLIHLAYSENDRLAELSQLRTTEYFSSTNNHDEFIHSLGKYILFREFDLVSGLKKIPKYIANTFILYLFDHPTVEYSHLLNSKKFNDILNASTKDFLVESVTPLFKEFFKRLDNGLTVLMLDERVGIDNRNLILHHYSQKRNAPYVWPMKSDEVEDNHFCQCCLHAQLAPNAFTLDDEHFSVRFFSYLQQSRLPVSWNGVHNLLHLNHLLALLFQIVDHKHIQHLDILLSADFKQFLQTNIARSTSESVTPLFKEFFKRLDNGLTVLMLDERVGIDNRNLILHHYSQKRDAPYVWPMKSDEVENDHFCQSCLHASLPPRKIINLEVESFTPQLYNYLKDAKPTPTWKSLQLLFAKKILIELIPIILEDFLNQEGGLFENYADDIYRFLHNYFSNTKFNWPTDAYNVEGNPICLFYLNRLLSAETIAQLSNSQIENLSDPIICDLLIEQEVILDNNKIQTLKALCEINPNLFPLLLIQNKIDIEEIGELNQQNLRYTLLATACEQFESIEKLVAQFEFIQSEQIDFYQTFIFDPLCTHINKLQHDPGNLFKSAGTIKARQMTTAKKHLLNLITQELSNISTTSEIDFPRLNNTLMTSISQYANDKIIRKERNHINTFFHGLAGVLLAIPTGFTLLISKSYRNTFFKPHSDSRKIMKQTYQNLSTLANNR